MRAIFNGSGKPAHYDAVAASAGAMFYLNGTTNSIAEGVAHAKKLIDNGDVDRWLRTHEEAEY